MNKIFQKLKNVKKVLPKTFSSNLLTSSQFLNFRIKKHNFSTNNNNEEKEKIRFFEEESSQIDFDTSSFQIEDSNFDDLLSSANENYYNDNKDLAYSQLLKCKELDPSNKEVSILLGNLAFERGEYELALPLIEHSLSHDNNDGTYQNMSYTNIDFFRLLISIYQAYDPDLSRSNIEKFGKMDEILKDLQSIKNEAHKKNDFKKIREVGLLTISLLSSIYTTYDGLFDLSEDTMKKLIEIEPNNDENYFLQGMMYSQGTKNGIDGCFKKTLESFEMAKSLNSSNDIYFYLSGMNYLVQSTIIMQNNNNIISEESKKYLSQAQYEFERAIELNEAFPDSYFKLAETYISLDMIDKAEETYKSGEKHADNAYHLVLIGRFYMSVKNDYTTAIKYYEQAIDEIGMTILPNSELYFEVGQCYYALINNDVAEKKNDGSGDDVAKEMFLKAVEVDITGECVFAQLIGDFYARNGKFLTAIEFYEKGFEVLSSLSKSKGTSMALMKYSCGNVYVAMENYIKAIECFESSKDADETFGASYYSLGMLYRDVKGEYNKAKEVFEKLISFEKNNDVYYNELGVCCTLTGDYEDGKKYIQKAIEMNDHDALYYKNLGHCLSNLAEYDNAVKMMEKALEIDPDNITLYSDIAVVYATQKDYEMAEKYIRIACEISPHILDLQYSLASVLGELGKFDEALEIMDKIENQDEYKESLNLTKFFKSDLYGKMEEWNKAKDSIEGAIKITEPNAPEYKVFVDVLKQIKEKLE